MGCIHEKENMFGALLNNFFHVQLGWEKLDEGRFEADVARVMVTESGVEVSKTVTEKFSAQAV
jgi:hypothetical protein